MVRRSCSLGVLAAATLSAAASPAGAQTLAVDRPCVNESKPFAVTGAGFAPGATIEVQAGPGIASRLVAGPDGSLAGEVASPLRDRSSAAVEQVLPVVALDGATRAPLTQTSIIVTEPKLLVLPRVVDARRAIRFRTRGFTPGQPVFAHVRRDERWVRTVRLGVAKGPCGLLDLRKKVLNRLRGMGNLKIVTIQVDQVRKPSVQTRPQGTATLVIRRPVGYAWYRFRAQVLRLDFKTE